MSVSKFVTGIQHIGVPTNDIQKTIQFYNGLGFETVFQTVNAAANEKVAFLKLKNLIIETYQNNNACEIDGAIDHIAIDVTDIEKVFDVIKANGYLLLNEEVQFLPFWERGVKFFTIKGPNAEKVEFSQIV